MPSAQYYNALVINSNLATPIPKKAGAPNPGSNAFSRLHYYGRTFYYPEPNAEFAERATEAHVVVPNCKLEDPTYSVYAFVVPNQIRLRVVRGFSRIEDVPPEQYSVATKLALINYGITLEIDTPSEVRVSPTYIKSGVGVEWQVQGEAVSKYLGQTVFIRAQGIRGHAVPPMGGYAGRAAIERL